MSTNNLLLIRVLSVTFKVCMFPIYLIVDESSACTWSHQFMHSDSPCALQWKRGEVGSLEPQFFMSSRTSSR